MASDNPRDRGEEGKADDNEIEELNQFNVLSFLPIDLERARSIDRERARLVVLAIEGIPEGIGVDIFVTDYDIQEAISVAVTGVQSFCPDRSYTASEYRVFATLNRKVELFGNLLEYLGHGNLTALFVELESGVRLQGIPILFGRDTIVALLLAGISDHDDVKKVAGTLIKLFASEIYKKPLTTMVTDIMMFSK